MKAHLWLAELNLACLVLLPTRLTLLRWRIIVSTSIVRYLEFFLSINFLNYVNWVSIMILSCVQTKTSRRTKNTCSSDSIYLDLKLDNFTEDASSWACKTISTLKSKSCDGYVYYELLRASTPPYSDDQVFVILREFLQPDTAIPLKSTAYCILALLPEEDPLSLVVASSGELCLELA
jgi:hypothetical protein